MKLYKIPLLASSVDIFFKPIRNKKDIIKLLMNTVKYIGTEINIGERTGDYIFISIDDMNRFIYQSDNKVFSIRSPFLVKQEESSLKFYTKNVEDIDNYLTSQVLSLINHDKFDTPSFFEFGEIIEEYFENPDKIWSFIMELISYEDGYLRFDNDPDHADERMHPLNHLDVCYSNASTFKVGTYNKPCVNYMFELLNNNIESKYLEKNDSNKMNIIESSLPFKLS